VLTAPAASVLVATYYAARLPQAQGPHDLGGIRQQWLAMLKLGIPLMAAGLLMLTTQLAVRSIVLRDLGLEASGYFQAAWAISVTYVGLVLNALVMDYFPRLTTAIGDHDRAKVLVNEQAEMTLLVAGPILMAMITLAPWVIHLLYAKSFSPAADILRWQVLGDLFKIASVPAAFIFVAAGHGGVAIGIQILWSAAYLGVLALGISEFGLVMAGVGFGIAYLIYYVVVAFGANRLIGYKPTHRNSFLTLLLFVAGSIVMILSAWSVTTSYAAGLVATLLVSIYSIRRLDNLLDLTGWLRLKFL
ncbi:MAG: oligosaccharide flippase family protein, partial [Woeseia sp.]